MQMHLQDPVASSRAWQRAAIWGTAGFAIGLAMSAPLSILNPGGGMGEQAAAARIYASGPWAFGFAVLLFAPLYETLAGQSLPIELMRKLRVPCLASLAICALLFGVLYYRANGINHGIKTFVSGLLYAELYLRTRPASALASWATVAGAHFVNNLWTVALLAVAGTTAH